MHPLVLFWSQNADLYLLFSHILTAEGFKSALVDDQELEKQMSAGAVLAIVLDTENRTDEALRLCSLAKGNSATVDIPVLALLPGSNEQEYLDLLKAGVNEGFVRPVPPARIVAYLRSLVSRMPEGAGGFHSNGDTLNIGEFSIDARRRLVRHGRNEIQLPPIEFKLLCRLLEAPGRVFSRAELIEAAWPPSYYVQPRTVDVHVGHLRRSLARVAGRNVIRTIRSSGYAAEFG